MADNILKGIIEIEAKGVGTSLNQVNTAIAKTETGFKKLAPASNQATLALSNLGRVAQDAPYGFIGIANNLNPLLESFQRLKETTKTNGGALKALAGSLAGPAGVGIALSVVSSLLVVFGDKLFGASKQAKKLAEDVEKAKERIDELLSTKSSDVLNIGIGNTGAEIAQITALSKVVLDQTRTYKERNTALEELKKIDEDRFGRYKIEEASLKLLTKAVEDYKKEIIATSIVKAFGDEIGKVAKEQSTQINLYNKLGKAADDAKRKLDATQRTKIQGSAGGGMEVVTKEYNDAQRVFGKANDALKAQSKIVSDLAKQYTELENSLNGAVDNQIELLSTKPKSGDTKDLEKWQREQIALAKKIFSAKKDRISLELNIEPDDNFQTEFEKSIAFLNDYRNNNFIFKTKMVSILDGTSAQDLAKEYYQKLAEAFKKESRIFRGIIPELTKFEDSLNKPVTVKIPAPKIVVDSKGGTNGTGGLFDEQLATMSKGINNAINSFVSSIAVEGLATVGEAIGAALAGGSMQDVFGGFVSFIAEGVTSLGRQLIELGAIAKLADAALKSLFTNPVAAIAAGVALVAIGSAMKTSLKKGVAGARALGGPVGSGGSYIVGERGPELFTPNVNGSIIPNSRMGSYGGGSLGGQVQFVISGNNLIGVLSSAGRNQRRLV